MTEGLSDEATPRFARSSTQPFTIMNSYVVSHVRFTVPRGFVAGRYAPYHADPEEPYSGEHLNDAIVVFPFKRLSKAQREEHANATALIPNIPEEPLSVRLFISYGKNQMDDETSVEIAGRIVYRSGLYDVWGQRYTVFRVFVLRSKMVEVHIPCYQKVSRWHPLISSLESTRRSS